jgi:hypothetical protein
MFEDLVCSLYVPRRNEARGLNACTVTQSTLREQRDSQRDEGKEAIAC